MKKRGKNEWAGPLAIIRQRDGPTSAYEALDHLCHGNRRLGQPAIYRVLAALAERTGARSRETRRTFGAHKSDSSMDASDLLICDGRGKIKDWGSQHLLKEPSSIAEASGFAPKRPVIPVHGQRASCAAAEAPA